MNKKDYKILLVSTNTSYRFSNLETDQLAGYLRINGYNADLFHPHSKNMLEDIKNLPLTYDLYYFCVTKY